ncbi:DUF6525 family protein [Roseivivax halotolerans]|uniref:DUF6525 family protein n=1 Tax=Roseivivax halotolerans TaxID=93684 RepID=UPI003CCC06BC
MSRNLTPPLRRRRRGDPMRSYYRLLPARFRHARTIRLALWSPASCLGIWREARKKWTPISEIIANLDRLERAAIERSFRLQKTPNCSANWDGRISKRSIETGTSLLLRWSPLERS